MNKIKSSCPWGIVPLSLLIQITSLIPLAKLDHFICINICSDSGFLENKEGIFMYSASFYLAYKFIDLVYHFLMD